jgi:hypothetical protein
MMIRVLWTVCILATGRGASQTPIARQPATTQFQSEPAPQTRQTNPASLMVLHADVPLYPVLARAARLSGTVRVRVGVKGGAVVSAVPESTAHQILQDAARDNVITWRFGPDIDASFEATFIYELANGETTVPENPHVEMWLPSLLKITARPTKATPDRAVLPGQREHQIGR